MYCDSISTRAPTRGSTTVDFHVVIEVAISIRAPTRGAIWHGKQIRYEGYISIRAPTRGATKPLRDTVMTGSFQSALPRGERHRRRAGKYQSACISIRAPTRGATIAWLPLPEPYRISIRAPTRGATRSPSGIWTYYTEFQSALPRGERPTSAIRRRIGR